MTTLVNGVAAIAGRYDGFILDLWGVIHDGVTPYPGAVATLQALKAASKRVVLLSNAPRRSWSAAEAMRGMGIADTLYDAILTSGEVTHTLLRDRDDPWFASLGQRVFHLGPERDRNVFDTLDLHRVETPGQAEFVINTGPDDHLAGLTIETFAEVLDACRQARLPMVCANPDLEVIRGGNRVLCAGALAVAYAAIGGDTRVIGKPDPLVFDRALAMMDDVGRDRVVMVGDSLRTDIAGAKAAGLDAVWVLGGIHAEALGPAPSEAAITAEAARHGLYPAWAMAAFT